MRPLTLLLLLAACAPAAHQQTPAAAPALPPRPENAAVAIGTVRDAAGAPVPFARLTGWAADAACQPVGDAVSSVAGPDGSYQLRVERGVGPQFDACIVVEASAGGSRVRTQSTVRYAPDAARNNGVRVDLMLPQPPLLTRAEADRLAEIVRAAVSLDNDALAELQLYVPNAREALTPIARYTRGIESARLVTEGNRHYVYELIARRPERNVRLTIRQDTLTRIELPQVE
jgi:hypothetical protein